MELALQNAGIEKTDIGYINAHATSTKLGDIAESQAIRRTFGEDTPPVSSTKGVTGHMLGASGVIEAAVSMYALRRGLLPPTFNLEDPDPACDVDLIRKGGRATNTGFVLSNSFGFGGHNVSLVFGHPGSEYQRDV
jgi:3-oxoacyl-[acyl-carrier-protein] synthase II